MTDKNKKEIKAKAKDFDLDKALITFEQGFSTDEKSISETEILKNKMNALSIQLKASEQK